MVGGGWWIVGGVCVCGRGVGVGVGKGVGVSVGVGVGVGVGGVCSGGLGGGWVNSPNGVGDARLAARRSSSSRARFNAFSASASARRNASSSTTDRLYPCGRRVLLH